MSTNALGLPLPLPVTASFALPLSLYYIFLQIRVVTQRVTTKTVIAQETSSSSSSSSSTKSSSSSDSPPTVDPLFIANRAQANFIENVPLALLLSAFAEINGGSKTYLTSALAALTIARVLHVEAGLLAQGNKGPGRPIGFLTTLVVNLGLAVYGGVLVKGYWGY
ncbi:hypothetical protein CERZMDRAFT_94510 [Cercospora zeae-maydis SCOH1-5]|uniref:Uncharacterized protein n=1 Tax=Cercospora zeae-maydis SCOH1-5 TaxID=717836 RepID=A0A6A6FNS0_9PEZI|nr:hypothetical protein CERZMDRAFT_94510 [Cercospora zeae-maydis SCOH1-5]